MSPHLDAMLTPAGPSTLLVATPPDGSLEVAEFRRHNDTQPNHKRLASFSTLADYLRTPVIEDSKEGVSLWSPVTYVPGTTREDRFKCSVAIWRVHAAAFEVDCLPLAELDAFLARLESSGEECIVYSSYSHRGCSKCGDGAHIRVIFRLARPVAGWDWARVWEGIKAVYVPEADEASKDAKRMFYKYSHPQSRAHLAFFRHLNPGVSP